MMQKRHIIALSIVVLLTIGGVAYPQEGPNLLVINGTFYTSDPSNPVAQAVYIQRGKIEAVGTISKVMEQAPAGVPVMDLNGKTVVPGFIDSHGHLSNLGFSLQELNLVGTKTYEEVIALVRERAANARPGEWLVGRGWDQNDWPDKEFPFHQALSEVTPSNPVFLVRVDGHAALVNAAAMRIAGLNRETAEPSGGKIIRDSEGVPTGVLIDRAVGSVQRHIPKRTKAQRRRAIRLAVQECLKYGITSVHDAGVDGTTLDLYKSMSSEGKLRLRIYAMISSNDRETLQRYFDQGPLVGHGADRLTIRSVKVVADGALGSRGAALLTPYSDDPGNTGLLIVPQNALQSLTESALKAGFQVSTHAIGDRANRVALNAYEAAMNKVPDGRKDSRLRIEHAQIVALEDIPRFQALGVIPSMQPSHATSDMPWAEQRVGPERIQGAYAWRKFIKAESRIAAGSDFPVENVNPLWGFYSAIARQDHEGQPAEGWYPLELMSRDEALHSFTINGAYAAFEEDTKGSIAVGKWADLTVLSADIMKIPPKQILTTEVEMTLLGGRIAYRK